MRLVDVEPLDCLTWKDGEHGTTFDDGVLWVLEKIGELPSVQTCDDAMSRQAAIDEMKEWILDTAYLHDVVKCLRGLPPVQPEIVRCVDCIHSDTFPKDADNDMPLKCLGVRYGGVMPDWYCEHAERRTE